MFQVAIDQMFADALERIHDDALATVREEMRRDREEQVA